MAINIDNINEIRELDSKNMASSIAKLPNQIEQIFAESKLFNLPASYRKVKNIVLYGMGGSALGTHCVRSIYEKEIKVPFEIVNNYYKIGSVNKDTLAIVISYSGTTEETIAALKEMRKAKAKVVVITSGGELARSALAAKVPALIFSTENNPCGSPRMGLGYTFFGPLFLLAKLNLIKNSSADVKKVIATANKYLTSFGLENPDVSNLAKQMSGAIVRGGVWYVASEHLAGSVHTISNQMNENGKRFASYFLIPELNHHLLEGLKFPESDQNTFLFIESGLYDKRTQKRYIITKEILTSLGKQFLTYTCNEKTKLLQAVEVLVLGSYISYYSAILKGIDPTAIPTVDFLKSELKK